MKTLQDHKSIVALDVGERRIGVAVASLAARLPRPWGVIEQTADTLEHLHDLLRREQATALVVGLPRGLNGQETNQTAHVRSFINRLQSALQIPVYWMDEALTSHQAETELTLRKKPYSKGDIDALAACYILNDFLATHAKDLSK